MYEFMKKYGFMTNDIGETIETNEIEGNMETNKEIKRNCIKRNIISRGFFLLNCRLFQK